MLWTVGGAIGISFFVLRQDWLDRLNPSPEDWPYMVKYWWRKACVLRSEAVYGDAAVDWGGIHSEFFRVVASLESGGGAFFGTTTAMHQTSDWETYDFPGFDKDLVKRESNSTLGNSQGLSRIGCDISLQPEPWRRCYHGALMNMAKSAEMDYGWVRDRKSNILFPPDQVVGPSNPYPKPVWGGGAVAPPLEENCEQAFEDPSFYYVRILTTKGLTPRQRLDAGLAYAAWLDYKGDTATARSLYRWAIDLACESFSSANPSTPVEGVINRSSGIIDSQTCIVTRNILTASTALAAHCARQGELSTALAVFLSVLRAYRSAPINPSYVASNAPDLSLRNLRSITDWILSQSTMPSMGPAPPSGDAAFSRDHSTVCEEAALMLYIGEILFSAADGGRWDCRDKQESRKREALSWTRDAVAMAEHAGNDTKLSAEHRQTCMQCLEAGLDNWWAMVNALAYDGGSRRQGKEGGSSWWAMWTPFTSGEDVGVAEDWADEVEVVRSRRAIFMENKLMAQLDRSIRSKSSWLAM